MERVRWTDERIDERMAAMDEKFDRLFDELHSLRDEMRAGFGELRGEIVLLRTELGKEILASHRQVTFIVAGLAIALIGLLGAAVAQL
jgi:hypothetical protein